MDRHVDGADRRVIVCDASALGKVDLSTIDRLARLQLAALVLERAIRVAGAPPELREVIALVGLAEVLPCFPSAPGGSGLPLEPGRQAEQREEPRGVQEERDAADPVAGDLEHLN